MIFKIQHVVFYHEYAATRVLVPEYLRTVSQRIFLVPLAINHNG